ncbi:hypothetical protein CLU79DRAFT_729465 [Phycomyces nitens]|nr:hypothetical protein CLU79DRAFT_729465 [Phycomyces nitens]
MLEALMCEPIDYEFLAADQTCRLSPEVVQSLGSVKQVCLVALDSLLKKIVLEGSDGMRVGREMRRLSDSSLQERRSVDGGDLLGSIARYTTRITHAELETTQTTMINIKRQLDSHQVLLVDVSVDYNLCCALAALLNDVYRMLELGHVDTQDNIPLNHSSENVYLQLQEEVSEFQKNHAAGLVALEYEDSKEMTVLWSEIERLMHAVDRITKSIRSNPPPAYSDLPPTEEPPCYPAGEVHGCPREKKRSLGEKTQRELDNLLEAIDRLSSVAPRLNNQRVTLTERQANELAMATVSKAVERLSRGRLDDQRAHLPQRHDLLKDLVQQINKSAARTLDNQRVHMGDALQKRIEVAKVTGVLNRMDRGRLTNQDWCSPEEILLQEMTTMTDLLAKSLHRPQLTKQRYSLPAMKERTVLSTDTLFRKVQKDTQEDTRDELALLMDTIYKAKPQFENQRASFSSRQSYLTSIA